MRTKTRKTVEVTLYGAEGRGHNLTEARKDAIARIEEAFAGSYTPYFLKWRGMSAVVWREPSGWCTHYLHDEHDYAKPTPMHSFPNDKSRDDALASAALNLAQCGWEESDGFRTPDVLTPYQHKLNDYRSWVDFQLRYKEGIRQGMNDQDAHSFAGRNPARRELWEGKGEMRQT